MMLDTWVLDSYAVLALLQGEPGAEDVLKQIEAAQQGKSRVLMTWVNVGEVLYTIGCRTEPKRRMLREQTTPAEENPAGVASSVIYLKR